MPKTPPPLQGFNNNVKHRGHIFHIQTEDSGIRHPHIVTHLFADGGRIVKSHRTDYSEHVGRADMPQVLRALMKEQHKAMFVALRAGEYDDLIDDICGPAGGQVGEGGAPERADRGPSPPAREDPLPVPRPGAPVPAAGSEPIDFDAIERAVGADGPQPPAAAPREVRRTSSGRYAAARPAAIFDAAPAKDGGSIFGNGVISEKSLDEVILSYLAEDLESTQGTE